MTKASPEVPPSAPAPTFPSRRRTPTTPDAGSRGARGTEGGTEVTDFTASYKLGHAKDGTRQGKPSGPVRGRDRVRSYRAIGTPPAHGATLAVLRICLVRITPYDYAPTRADKPPKKDGRALGYRPCYYLSRIYVLLISVALT